MVQEFVGPIVYQYHKENFGPRNTKHDIESQTYLKPDQYPRTEFGRIGLPDS